MSPRKTREELYPSPRRKHPPRRSAHHMLHHTWLGISAVILIACGVIGFTATLGAALLLNITVHTVTTYTIVDTNRPIYAESPVGPDAAASPLSSVFTAEVRYWGPLISAWGIQYQIDPNLIATVIQIESCGDPTVSSPSGAQGLFQVMPFHFAEGEDMLEVQTNARRGLDYLSGGLNLSDGHAGLALAGYNGGHGMINRGWGAWADETRRYYYWGSRIYAEAVSGMTTSPTLLEWLSMGGNRLCERANQAQQQLEAQRQQQAQPVALVSP